VQDQSEWQGVTAGRAESFDYEYEQE